MSIMNIIKIFGKISLLLIAITSVSVISTSYHRDIQERVNKFTISFWENNPKVAEGLTSIHKLVLNGERFDKEARIKTTISTHYRSVVLVSTRPKEGANPMVSGSGGALGTGFFIEESDTHALVMTNHHVVGDYIKNPDSVDLTIQTVSERWPYPAEMVGYDEVSDIAILKITKLEDENWPSLPFADYKSIREGDPVVVIGHGMSMPWTATSGHVTYNGRGTRPYKLMLQVDAVVNQGNSGGPIISLEGEVVGVAQSIFSPGRQIPGWDGIGLGVHARHAKKIMDYVKTDKYKEQGYVPYAAFPVPVNSFVYEDVKDITREDRHYIYVDYTQGATSTTYAAQAAGLKQGDVITEIDGKRMWSNYNILSKTIYSFPGDVITFKVIRSNPAAMEKQELEIQVTLEETNHAELIALVNRRGGR